MTVPLLLAAPIIVPLGGAGLAALAHRRRGVQRLGTAMTVGLVVAAGIGLTVRSLTRGVVHTVIGSEEALTGIALTADPLGAALVAATGLLAAAAVGTMIAVGDDDHPLLHPALLTLLTGACGSFVAGDLFTIFVLLEVVMISSAVLLVLHARPQQLRLVAVYVMMNLLGTTLLLTGIAVVFASAGTVNLALLAERAGALGGAMPGAVLVVLAFAVKAGLLPFSGWLVLAYPVAQRTVMALFVGSLTTVGVAALYRVGLLVFGRLGGLSTILLAVGAGTALLASFGALAAADSVRALALVVVTQVGFMIIGFGLSTTAGVVAGVVFILQDVLVKTAVVLAYRPLEPGLSGGSGRPATLMIFAVLALSLAGVPPLTGFLGKALLVEAALDARAWSAAAAALAASAVTLAALLRLWWNALDAPAEAGASFGGARRDALGLAPAAIVAVAAITLGVIPAPLLTVGEAAADSLLDPAAYAEEVLGR